MNPFFQFQYNQIIVAGFVVSKCVAEIRNVVAYEHFEAFREATIVRNTTNYLRSTFLSLEYLNDYFYKIIQPHIRENIHLLCV